MEECPAPRGGRRVESAFQLPRSFPNRGRQDDDMQYSEGFKARMVLKMLEPAEIGACGLSRETGVPAGHSLALVAQGREAPWRDKDTNNDDQAATGLERGREAGGGAAGVVSERGGTGGLPPPERASRGRLVAWRKTVLLASRAALSGERTRKSRKPTEETWRICELEKALGSVRGAPGNRRPHRDRCSVARLGGFVNRSAVLDVPGYE